MSSSSHSRAGPKALERRLLNDIAEIQQDPYPNVHLHFDEANMRKACLILTPDDEDPLHLTIEFGKDYPLCAPTVKIQTSIVHPNVFGDYICATILNTTDGWTSAYTLKGIVIQILSFFCSDSLEQDHGRGNFISLADYRRCHARQNNRHSQPSQVFTCKICGFGPDWRDSQDEEMEVDEPVASVVTPTSIKYITTRQSKSKLFSLPDEVVLLIFNEMETRDILAFAEAVPSIQRMVHSYDFIRIRELQCFCLKQSFMETKLGIGVAIAGGRRAVFRSEFDLLSQDAFYQHGVRRSIQGVRFDKWLPLPLSRRHWSLVRTNATACIKGIHTAAQMEVKEPGCIDVLYYFMNNIVVQFSADTEKGFHRPDARSTLSHASEKAVEAYFALYHLFLCLATEDLNIVASANRIVARFIAGPRTKAQFPDLGHVLVASLTSDAGLTEELTFLVIKEAILRNVVWMLDTKGAGFAELAYLEPSAVSQYRLVNTFAASPISYRLLMFLKLFSSAVRAPGKSLLQLRDALFDTHSAPPPGTAAKMAERVRQIRAIDGFPGFLDAMGIKDKPSAEVFTAFLRRTIGDSVSAGYSCMSMTQSELYMIRKIRERNVEVAKGVNVTPALEKWYEQGEKWFNNGWNGRPSFFPGGNRGGDGGIGGRGRGRGHGRGRGGRGRGF